jgi:hypothetical protein
MTRLALVLIPLALAAACSKSAPEPDRSPQPASAPSSEPTTRSAPATPPAGATVRADDVAWDAPAAWQTVPNANTMRKATYKIPRAAGDTEDAELTVSSAGGGVEANIKRWAGQFGNVSPKTENKTVHDLKVTLVEIQGTYASGGGMMGGATTPKDKYMLLGAVVDGGDRQHFFKMTGPEKTVTAAKKDFDSLVASLRAK